MSRLTRSNLFQDREQFSDFVHRAAYAKERIIVSYRGKDLALVIPIEDLGLLKHLPLDKMKRLDLEQPIAKATELGANVPNQDGLSRFTTAGLHAARRRKGVPREGTYSNPS